MTDRLTKEAFLAAFAERDRRGVADSPSWLRELRRAAIARFAERGLPTTRDEAWKYTSLAPIAATRFDLTAESAVDDLPEEAIAPFLMGSPAWSRLVFVNGAYSAKL